MNRREHVCPAQCKRAPDADRVVTCLLSGQRAGIGPAYPGTGPLRRIHGSGRAPRAGPRQEATRALRAARSRTIRSPHRLLIFRIMWAVTRSGSPPNSRGKMTSTWRRANRRTDRAVCTKAPLTLIFSVSPITGSPNSGMSRIGIFMGIRWPQRCSMTPPRSVLQVALPDTQDHGGVSPDQYALVTRLRPGPAVRTAGPWYPCGPGGSSCRRHQG